MFRDSVEPFHVTADGKIVPFCTMLNCFDQPCYFEFRKVSEFDPWLFFCDDINLEIYENSIAPYSTGIKNKYQNINKYIIKENHFGEISNLLEENKSLILSTAFNYVIDYDWWGENAGDEKYLHVNHNSYIIGEDKENYYIVDSPSIFRTLKKIRCENKAIVKIPKDNFSVAFQKYCEVTCISYHDLPKMGKDEYQYLEDTLCRIYKNYNSQFCIGRNALLEMNKLIQNKDGKILENIYGYYMMVCRRVVLKRCLNKYWNEILNKSDMLYCLDDSILRWNQIRILVSKLKEGKSSDYNELEKKSREIIIAEDRVFKQIKEVLEKCVKAFEVFENE